MNQGIKGESRWSRLSQPQWHMNRPNVGTLETRSRAVQKRGAAQHVNAPE